MAYPDFVLEKFRIFLFLSFYSLAVFQASCGAIKYNVNGIKSPYFVVTEFSNNRVLIFQSFPVGNQSADIVLGQSTMTTSGTGLSASTLNGPISAVSDGQRLYVSDFSNNRVLIWNSIPTQNGQPADLVLGQPNMTTGTIGGGSQGLQTPVGITIAQNKLFVTDYENSRVLIWNSLPTQNQQPADVVVGQTTMAGVASAGTRVRFNHPTGTAFDGQRLYVRDRLNNRILIWNSLPTVSQQAADLVLGQSNFSSITANAGTTVNALGFDNPIALTSVDGKRLMAVDANNNRLLIWNSIPSQSSQSADAVIGQVNLTSKVAGTTAQNFSVPTEIYSNGLESGVWRPSGY
ncbi:MAG: hypothetical protein SGI74_01030 [Oligoflexia bacterium]|nr:hypothetical protein [Oligoflexia bacterium]